MKGFLIVASCLLWLWGSLARGQEAESTRQRVIEIIASLPKWNSVDSESFHFERILSEVVEADGDDEQSVAKYGRVNCDHRTGADTTLMLDGFEPIQLRSGNVTYEFEDGIWAKRTSTWTCQLKEQMPAPFLNFDCEPLQNGPIVVELPKYLSAGLGEDLDRAFTNRTTNSVIAVKTNKSWLEIRLRSPNDSEKLGCELSEVVIVPKRLVRRGQYGHMSLRSFMTKEIPGVRLRIDEKHMNRLADPVKDGAVDGWKSNPFMAVCFSFEDTKLNSRVGLPLHAAVERTAAVRPDTAAERPAIVW